MTADSSYNEHEVLHSVAAGDKAAFTLLFGHYRDRIYSIAFRLTHQPSVTEEIVQEVFLTIWLKRSDIPGIQNFSAYLFIVTRNKAYKALKDIARNYKTMPLTEEAGLTGNNDTDSYILRKEYIHLLQQAIDRLPIRQKQVYQLIKEQRLKREEVADMLQLQPETVKFHLAQAMKNIRAFCAPHVGILLAITVVLSFPA